MYSTNLFLFCRIPGHFGSVVSSYFVFLRWIFFVNLNVAILFCGLIIVPEVRTTTTQVYSKLSRDLYTGRLVATAGPMGGHGGPVPLQILVPQHKNSEIIESNPQSITQKRGTLLHYVVASSVKSGLGVN